MFYFLLPISKIYSGYECKESQGFQRVLYKKNNFFQRDGYKWIHNCWFVYPYENTSILKEIQMNKSCAFLGNDYQWSRSDIVKKVKEQALRLIDKEGVDTFLVGVKGAYERDAYNAVLQIKQDNPSIRIVFVASSMKEVNDGERYFDSFVYPDRAAIGYKRWCIVHRNNWIIKNTDFIISYNQLEGRAFEVCKRAKNKGVQVIELANKE